MKRFALLLAVAVLLGPAPALAQGRDGERAERREVQRERLRDDRRELRRERMDRHERREHRFTREERDKLRQDLLDANREMKGRRQ